MSKRLLIIIYVTAVLIFSGFVTHAKPLPQTVAPISLAVVDAEGVLRIYGQINTLCQMNPVINTVPSNNDTLYLEVLVSNKPGRCEAVVLKNFELAYDLKNLSSEFSSKNSIYINGYMSPVAATRDAAPGFVTGYFEVN